GLFPFTVLHGTGGADVIAGTGAAEIIDAGGAPDIIDGRGGAGIITGGGGAGTFKFEGALSGPIDVPRIMDYSFAGGDVVALSALLDPFFGPNSNVMDFARVVEIGNNLVVQVDTDGPANGTQWSNVAILDGSGTEFLDEVTAYFDGANHSLMELDARNIQTVA